MAATKKKFNPGGQSSALKLLATINKQQEGCATAGQLSRIYGLTIETIRLKLRGVEPYGKIGREKVWKLEEAELYLTPQQDGEVPTMMPAALNTPPSPFDADIEAAKLRRATADADKAELITAQLRGDLISVKDARDLMMEVMQLLYKRFCVVGPRELGVMITEAVRGGEGSRQVSEHLREHAIRVFNDVGQSRLFNGQPGSGVTVSLAERNTD